LRQLLDRGLSDVSGAEASVRLPVSKRLLNDLVTAALPPSAPVRDLDVTPLDDDRFLVRGRIGTSALLPGLRLKVAIDRQPAFPENPVLVLRLEGPRVMSLAGTVLGMLTLPEWLRVERDRIHVDLRALLERSSVGRYVSHIDRLHVNTVAGAVMLSLDVRVR
jgi:hypothetical protein